MRSLLLSVIFAGCAVAQYPTITTIGGNTLTSPADMTNAAWGISGTTRTGGQLSEDGSSQAILLSTVTATEGHGISQTINVASPPLGNISAFAKKGPTSQTAKWGCFTGSGLTNKAQVNDMLWYRFFNAGLDQTLFNASLGPIAWTDYQVSDNPITVRGLVPYWTAQ